MLLAVRVLKDFEVRGPHDDIVKIVVYSPGLSKVFQTSRQQKNSSHFKAQLARASWGMVPSGTLNPEPEPAHHLG